MPVSKDSVRVVVIADSHSRADRRLKGRLPSNFERIIHCGDYSSMADYIEFSSWGKLDGVAGNTETTEIHRLLPTDLILEIGGVRIYVRHEVEPADFARFAPPSHRPGVVLFGHTHIPFVRRIGGILFVNPGSVSQPRCSAPPSFAELLISNGHAEAILRFL